MKTTFNFGTPLNVNGTRFINKRDRKMAQDAYAEKFIVKTNKAIMEIIGLDGVVDETGMSGGMVNIMLKMHPSQLHAHIVKSCRKPSPYHKSTSTFLTTLSRLHITLCNKKGLINKLH